jgi:hypothetical protein
MCLRAEWPGVSWNYWFHGQAKQHQRQHGFQLMNFAPCTRLTSSKMSCSYRGGIMYGRDGPRGELAGAMPPPPVL